jgi:hypothetical protein
MKKILLFAPIALLALASCKKDYTCECTRSWTYDGETETYIDKTTIKGVTKNTVKNSSDCVSYDYTEIEDGETYTGKADCKITKM